MYMQYQNPHKLAKAKKDAAMKTTVRINKHMADLGLASRREADELIIAGSVFVNGKRAEAGMQIDPKKDKVEIKSEKKSFVYYAYNKPMGIVTTGAQGQEKDILSTTKFPQKVFPLGRLDKESHGLILLTNDRRITHRLLDPEFEHSKEYRVTIAGRVHDKFLRKMDEGTVIKGSMTKKAEISQDGEHSFKIVLTEGKNRQIRRMVESAGDEVIDLIRLRIEHIQLSNLKEGTFRALSTKETATLLTKLGLK